VLVFEGSVARCAGPARGNRARRAFTGAAAGTSSSGWSSVTTTNPRARHPDDLDALVVLDDDGVRIVDPDVIEGVDAARPLDALTPVRVVSGSLPNGELFGDVEAAALLRRKGSC
jgi:hypothetical protein